MAEYRVPTTTKVNGLISTHAAVLETHGISGGLAASRPLASAAGKYYFCTDTFKWCRDNGTSWVEVSGLSESYIQGLIDASVSTHAADTSTHGVAVVAGIADIAVNANLSSAAQAAITNSHAAPTYDSPNGEVVFQI